MFNYIIIGAGFAGSVLAERIATRLNKKILLIEKRPHIGGNCYDYRSKEGIIIHKYGPHLFHTNYKEVWSYLSNFTDWNIYNHKVLTFIDGKKVPLPFNLNTLYEIFPHELARKLENRLLQYYEYDSKISILDLKKSSDNHLKFLADFVYKKFFLNYTVKQWGMRPEEIDNAVISRVPILIGKDDRYFNDKYQGVPEDGYTKLFENMLVHPNIKLMLNTNFKELIKIDYQNKKIYFLNREFKGKLIFTGMIDELFDYQLGELPYRSLNMKFEMVDREFYQEVATVNYPMEYDFTRITEFKHIHPLESKRTIILKEYPTEYIRNKNIPFYPVIKKENKKKYNDYLELLYDFKDIVLIGRLAEYKYYNMDQVIKRALEIFEEKIK